MSTRQPALEPPTPTQSFISLESMSGIALVAAAILAFAWANSPWSDYYSQLQETRLGLHLGSWHLHESLVHWVNDGLMAVFFFVVGLEIKRELLAGELSDLRQASLSVIAALGGIVLPVTVYAALAWGSASIKGWGVPMATDIAFALGILSLLGGRVPPSVKVLLTAVAIVDDLAAVLVIAVFYAGKLLMMNLLLCLGVLLLAAAYGWKGGGRAAVFGTLGVLAWYFMFKSGVHPTVAGVLLALTVPMNAPVSSQDLARDRKADRRADAKELGAAWSSAGDALEPAQGPLYRFESYLHPWAVFGIMPVFAIFNAGVSLDAWEGLSIKAPHVLGVILGLVVSKPVGILLFSWLGVRLGWASLPEGMGWGGLVCIGLCAGIGFTMSLFIAGLAFSERELLAQTKMAVLSASVLSACLGLIYTGWKYR